MLIGNVGMFLVFGILGVSIFFFYVFGGLLLFCLCLFMVVYLVSWGMVVWVVLVEIFLLYIRGMVLGIVSICL